MQVEVYGVAMLRATICGMDTGINSVSCVNWFHKPVKVIFTGSLLAV